MAVFLVALGVRALLALPQQQPHYFDAYYYYNVAENLQRGRGFVVDFIWNYLDRPEAVTHPSNLYWMPLSSVLASLPMKAFGVSYRAAQLPFVLLSSLPPVLAYAISWRANSRRDYAWLAAILTAFAPFYLKYWASPDNFAPFAVTACLSLLAMSLLWTEKKGRYALLAGGMLGLSHLARADGILLWVPLAAALAAIILQERRRRPEPHPPGVSPTPTPVVLWIGLALGGYLVVMAPWFWRNWMVTGAPLSSAGTKTIFQRTYADLFGYSADLNLESYLAWGWDEILRSKASAALHNLVVILGALQFHLVPSALVGLWHLRRRRDFVPFFVYASTLYLSMTLVFTFPSQHASMLHSTAALLPFLFAATLPGIDSVVGWIALHRRTWHPPTARRVFRFGLAALVVAISLFDYSRSVFLSLDPLGYRPLWNEANAGYVTVSQWLDDHGPDDVLVMVVDPPAYYYFTHRPCVVIPNEPLDGVLGVANKYGADYLILEYDHVPSLDPLYRGDASHPALALQHWFRDASGNEIQIYRIDG